MAKQRPAAELCPCGSGKPYADCCQPLHSGQAVASTAEQLMRSRYAAFARKQAPYLLRSWHRSTRPAEISATELEGVKWIQLEVRAASGGPDDTHGTVEFVARCKINGKAEKLHECSRFVREDGHWFYVDGEMLSN